MSASDIIPKGAELVRVDTAAKVLGIGKGLVYKLLNTGELESAIIGHHRPSSAIIGHHRPSSAIIGRRRLVTVRSIYKLIEDGVAAAAAGANAGMGCTKVDDFGASYRQQVATEEARAAELENAYCCGSQKHRG